MFTIKLKFPIWVSIVFWFCVSIYSVLLVYGIASFAFLSFRLSTFGFSLIISVLFFCIYYAGSHLPDNLQLGIFLKNAPFELAGAIAAGDSTTKIRFFTSGALRFLVAFGFVRVVEVLIQTRIL